MRGDVAPQVLGRTLTHEHLCMKFTHFYREPPQELQQHFTQGFKCCNVGYIRQYPHSSRYNLLFNDSDAKDAVLNDVQLYKNLGGGMTQNNRKPSLACIDYREVHIIYGEIFS